MNKIEIEETNRRYNDRFSQFGKSEMTLGWMKGRSNLRFKVLTDCMDDSQNLKILDFGCGFGDLYGYLSNVKNIKTDYYGVDINDLLISKAKELYPEANFVHSKKIATNKLLTQFDYIFVSGVFNHKLKDNFGFIETTIKDLYSRTNGVLAMNFLSNRVDFEQDHNYHADPCEILNLAYRYSNNVILANNYMPYEFTVFIKKAEPIDKKLNVYNSFLKYL